MKILCIEDDPMIRMVVTDTLSSSFPDATILAPASWEDAVKALESLSPNDVVVTDGYIWESKTARDVFAVLVRLRMNFRTVLYSANCEDFPDFCAFASKPGLERLIEVIREIAY